MANPIHLSKLKEGASAWNGWRSLNPNLGPDLAGASLLGADLVEANLEGANLCGASLGGANLICAKLSRADLTAAALGGANLSGADLRFALLVGANLNVANLNSANLEAADLSDAEIGFTSFANVDLSKVKGLDTVRHFAPSSIGVDTFYRSRGRISAAFLRRAGVPESFTEYMAALTGPGIEFYSLFISYFDQGDEREFAERLHADLQRKGVRCWFAPHNIKAGEKIQEQINAAIRVYDKLLLVLSPASMASEWVRHEVSLARKREAVEHRQVLIPISLVPFETLRSWRLVSAETGHDLARELREFYIPDFSNWRDHESYTRAFSSLLRAIATSVELGTGGRGGNP